MRDSDDVHAPKIKPYTYQEYPRMLHKPGGKWMTVMDDASKKAALDRGWLLTPPQPLPSEEDLDLVVAEQEIKNAVPARPGKAR